MAENNKKMVANADFEKEKNVILDIDNLSYICDYCGKVNQMGAPRCVRCGKRRPRSEYIDAMNKIKSAKSIKTEYLEEQYQFEEEKKEAAQQQLVRIVESRVEEEKRSIYAQEELRREQEREAIKKSTARDAVLRIIAAEKAAEDRVREAEQRAEDAVKGRNKEIEGIVEEERKKVLEAAAQKVVAARAGIEEAAREQIEANKKIADKFVRETLETERDKAERSAARRAVLRIIAAEKAADEKIKTAKDALQQAAVERIIEERTLADKEAAARYLAEKQAIERAADERIRAEKEVIRKLLEGRQTAFADAGAVPTYQQSVATGMPQQSFVQPLTIVPYVNTNQPLYQYRPHQVYKFVPKQTQPQQEVGKKAKGGKNAPAPVPAVSAAPAAAQISAPAVEKPKSGRARGMGIITLILAAAALVLALLPQIVSGFLPDAGFPEITAIVGIMDLEGNEMLKVIGFTVFVAFAFITVIQSVIRVIRGKAAAAGFIIPLIACAGLGLSMYTLGEGALAIMPMVIAGVSVLLLIFSIIGGVKSKKAK